MQQQNSEQTGKPKIFRQIVKTLRALGIIVAPCQWSVTSRKQQQTLMCWDKWRYANMGQIQHALKPSLLGLCPQRLSLMLSGTVWKYRLKTVGIHRVRAVADLLQKQYWTCCNITPATKIYKGSEPLKLYTTAEWALLVNVGVEPLVADPSVSLGELQQVPKANAHFLDDTLVWEHGRRWLKYFRQVSMENI